MTRVGVILLPSAHEEVLVLDSVGEEFLPSQCDEMSLCLAHCDPAPRVSNASSFAHYVQTLHVHLHKS
jgi:hypothetical protein